ncbi:MAG TPA: hypothetical protein VM581_03935 [Magnetospirillaceae bacterium]|nr:hypothetical protein [Magnetospirillaceae bacterium]
MVQQQGTQAKQRAAGFMTALGVAADISAVAVLVFNKDFSLFVQFASVAGVTVGLYLLIRQWGKPVGVRVLLAIVCITAGGVAGALSLVGPSTGGAGATFQFRLTPYQGIDLDASKHDVVDTDGPNGDFDIFMTKFGYLTVNNGSFYADTEGPDSEIYSRCTKALTAQREPEDQIMPQKSVRVCFKTSAGKTGWLRVNDAVINGQIYAVLNVQVW